MPSWTRPPCPPAFTWLTGQSGDGTDRQLELRLREGGGIHTSGVQDQLLEKIHGGDYRTGSIQPVKERKAKAKRKIRSKSTWGQVGE